MADAIWTEPKTNWTATDAFDYTQYNRVTDNITFLKAFADTLFMHLTDLSLEREKTNLSLIYARHMNDIENGLERLNQETYGLNIGETKTYKPNGKVPTYEEYNRIESASLALYETLMVHQNNLTRLGFTLGNQKGLKV